ncbi:MAG: P1 family peptidase [Candidatus Acidiferrales bacterium]
MTDRSEKPTDIPSENARESPMSRREFTRNVLAAGGALLASGGDSRAAGQSGSSTGVASAAGSSGGLTDVDGIHVGHFTDSRRPTGCTVVLCEKGAVAGVDVRGGAPGTRETDLLNPVNTVQQIYGVVLSGGSAFGLDTASGVMRYLDEKGIGFHLGDIVVPIVPAAILFDLQIGDPKIRPTADSGYAACRAANAGPVAEGNVGAGAGATIGKLFGMQYAMKSGLGTASLRAGKSGLIVAALAAVNAAGDVYLPPTGELLAGARTADGKGLRNSIAQIRAGQRVLADEGDQKNTTLAVVATNARLTKAQITKVAQMAQDGLARAINPVHTPFDGDTVFALATGTLAPPVDTGAVGALAAEVVAEAIVRAVLRATSVPGYPSHTDFSATAGG